MISWMMNQKIILLHACLIKCSKYTLEPKSDFRNTAFFPDNSTHIKDVFIKRK